MTLPQDYIQRLFERYQAGDNGLPDAWRAYFDERMPSTTDTIEKAHSHGSPATAEHNTANAELQDRIDQLIRAYRVRGHAAAAVNPLYPIVEKPTELSPQHYGLSDADLQRHVSSDSMAGAPFLSVDELCKRLAETYCRSIGVQFMHIDDLAIRRWLQDRMEGTRNRLRLTREQQLRILSRLTQAVTFEEFLQKKYIGAKTFSLEGCETLIPLLDLAIERASGGGINEIVIGMAHRGRLNVLANIMKKSPVQIFREFEDQPPEDDDPLGDVKYHLGHSCDWQTAGGRAVHLSLCFNPSHVEFINPVALGRTRAKQDRNDRARRQKMAFLIHGDAAFAGEGIVQEALNLSELDGFTTHGTLHIVVNNQLGFTTLADQGRSSLYATGAGRMLQIPIFHVNGKDPKWCSWRSIFVPSFNATPSSICTAIVVTVITKWMSRPTRNRNFMPPSTSVRACARAISITCSQ